MRSNQQVAISRKTTLVYTSLLTAVLALGGCSKGSGLRSAGGTVSTASGGNGGLHSTAVSTASGGNGGLHRTAGAGGEAGASGGSQAAGGATHAGGTTATGGRTASTSSAGGSAGTSGSSSLAGSGGASTWQSGGTQAAGGATSAGGTAGTSHPFDAAPGDGGIVSSGYCEGDSPKLTYQGQTVTPSATYYRSNIVMDCCNGYGVNLHASAWLGFDVAVELILSIDISTPKEYEVGGPSIGARAAVGKNGDSLTAADNSQGSLRVLGADPSTNIWQLGMCLEVTDTSADLWGTKIYVPKVMIGSSASNNRFQLFLLKDSTLRSDGVANQPLDDLVLAQSPVLDLNRIAYVEKATTKIGFNPGQKIGDSLRTQLGTPLGLPFVAVADGARIYLGTFFAKLSSLSPTGPNANVEDITTDGFTLGAPWSGADPRNDERILKVLTETGKLVP
jgi:hypothetical protein